MKFTLYGLALTIILGGCASSPELDYYTYRNKIETCEQFDMKVYVVRAVHNRKEPYVKGVMCRDEYGALWDTDKL